MRKEASDEHERLIEARKGQVDIFSREKGEYLVRNESWLKKGIYYVLFVSVGIGAMYMFIRTVQRFASVVVWQQAQGTERYVIYDTQCNPYGYWMERDLLLEQLGYPKGLEDINSYVTDKELYE